MTHALRGWFAATLLLTLTACGLSGSPGSSLGVGQAIADAQGIVTTLTLEAPTIQKLFPNVLPATGPVSWESLTNPGKTGWLDLAGASLSGLSAASPAAITDLASAEKDINLALGTLATITQAISSADPAMAGAAAAVEAAIVLAPGIEALINQMISAPGVAAARAAPAATLARAAAPHVTIPVARGILGIRAAS